MRSPAAMVYFPAMLTYPNIDPVAVHIGPLKIHWYGIMYLIGFGTAWWLGQRRANRPDSGWTGQQISDLIFYGALGAVLGGRIGYVLFYDLPVFLAEPLAHFQGVGGRHVVSRRPDRRVGGHDAL